MSKLRGVNLGEWLVLEKWMDTSMFEGTTATDEYNLCKMLDTDEKLRRFKYHRDTYITKEDIGFIKGCGLNSIRLPIPHFVFGDDPRFCGDYVGCIEYVDKCISWAEEFGLKVMLDIHTAPDCANGFDNGGICGVCKWHHKKENIDRMIQVLGMLADRYGKRDGLLGIELLNEPASEDVWERNKRNYEAHDKEFAKGSSAVPSDILFDFYTRGYEEIRRYMGEDKTIFFHDAFRFELWKNFFKESNFKNVALDSHWYLDMGDATERTNDLVHINRVMVEQRELIRDIQEVVPLIIGEWSLPHAKEFGMSDSEKYYSYRMLASAMLMTWERAYGHFFWSYRVKDRTRLGWDFRMCIDRDWLPSKFDQTEEK